MTEQEQKELQELQELEELAKLENLSRDGMALKQARVVEEMHPDLTMTDRMAVKNLSDEGSPEALKWLQSRHPDMNFIQRDGRIFAKKKGEDAYRPLDPDTGFFSKDFLKDVTDIGYDTLRGIPEAAATIAGGSVGGLPGAMVAGGISGAGTEALKQALAKQIGLADSYNLRDIGMSAGFSGGLPVAGTVAKGMYRFGKNSVFPPVMSFLSGVPKEVIKTTMNRLPELDALERGSLFEFSQAAKDRIVDKLFGGIGKSGSQLESAYQNSQSKVPLNQTAEHLETVLTKLKEIYSKLPTDQIKSEIEAIESLINQNFKTSPKQVNAKVFTPVTSPDEVKHVWDPETNSRYIETIPGNTQVVMTNKSFTLPPQPLKDVDPWTAWQLQRRVSKMAEHAKLPPTPQMVSPRYSDDTIRALDQTHADLGTALDKATNGVSSSKKENLTELYDLKENLQPYFGTPKQTYRTLTNLDTKSNVMLSELLEKAKRLTGVDVKPEADLLTAQSILGDKRPGGIPKWPVSSQGITSTSKTNAMTRPIVAPASTMMTGLGLGATQSPGMAFLGATGGVLTPFMMSPYATKQYIRLMHNAEKAAAKPSVKLMSGAAPRSAWHLLYGQDE